MCREERVRFVADAVRGQDIVSQLACSGLRRRALGAPVKGDGRVWDAPGLDSLRNLV